MTNVIQLRVVDRLANVLDRLLGIRRRDDFVLTSRHFVGGEDADLPTRHLFLVNHHGLRDVVHLRLHLGEIVRLQIEKLNVVRRQCVDLISDRCQRLCGEVLCFLQRRFLIFRSTSGKWSVKSRTRPHNFGQLTDSTSLRNIPQPARGSGTSPSGFVGPPGGPA